MPGRWAGGRGLFPLEAVAPTHSPLGVGVTLFWGVPIFSGARYGKRKQNTLRGGGTGLESHPHQSHWRGGQVRPPRKNLWLLNVAVVAAREGSVEVECGGTTVAWGPAGSRGGFF